MLLALLPAAVAGHQCKVEQKDCLPGRAVMGLSHSPLMTVCKETAAVQQHGPKMVQATPLHKLTLSQVGSCGGSTIAGAFFLAFFAFGGILRRRLYRL